MQLKGLEFKLEQEEPQAVSEIIKATKFNMNFETQEFNEILEALQEEKIGPIDKVLDEEESTAAQPSEELNPGASFGEGFSESYESIGNYTSPADEGNSSVYYNEFKKIQEEKYEGEPEKIAEDSFKQDTQERKIVGIFGTETNTLTLPTGLKMSISFKDYAQRVSEENWKVVNQATGWAWILYEMQNL